MRIKKKITEILNKNNFNKMNTHTRRINPKLGIFGVFGVMGFLGFMETSSGVNTVPFCLFFSFFGFFGFFYEGKMSNTFIDERFKENTSKAKSIGTTTGLMIIIIVTIVFAGRINDAKLLVKILISTIALAFGISGFLQQYLLYRFENKE